MIIMRSKDFDEDEILWKAINIFWEKGYNATSMHDLIDGLGIGRSSIYHAFGDKHNLFVKALERYLSEKRANLIGIIDTAPLLKIALETIFNAVIDDVFLNASPKGCFKINSEVEVVAHDEIVNEMLLKDDLLIEDAFHKAIKIAQQNHEISASKDPLALARFFCNTISGMRVYAKFKTDRQFFEDISKTARSVIE